MRSVEVQNFVDLHLDFLAISGLAGSSEVPYSPTMKLNTRAGATQRGGALCDVVNARPGHSSLVHRRERGQKPRNYGSHIIRLITEESTRPTWPAALTNAARCTAGRLQTKRADAHESRPLVGLRG